MGIVNQPREQEVVPLSPREEQTGAWRGRTRRWAPLRRKSSSS